MAPPQPSRLGGDFLILGEGERDVAFVKQLTKDREIATSLHVDLAGGQDGFGDRLSGYSALSRWKALKGVLLISDNDASSNKSFKKVKDQLNDGQFPSPPRALEIARKAGMPPLAVLMMPYPEVGGVADGCLETLLMPAMESANKAHFDHVTTALTNCGVHAWPKKGSRDKAVIRCNITVNWSDDPMLGLQLAFGKGLIPFNHNVFDGVAELLTNLEPWFMSDLPWEEWKTQNLPQIV